MMFEKSIIKKGNYRVQYSINKKVNLNNLNRQFIQ